MNEKLEAARHAETARKVTQDLRHAELTAHYQSMGEERGSASRMALAQMKGLPVRFAWELNERCSDDKCA